MLNAILDRFKALFLKDKPLKKVLLCLLFLFATTPVLASHIIGGFISMKQVDRQKGDFHVTFILYMDETGIYPDDELSYNRGFNLLKIFRKKDESLAISIFTKGAYESNPNENSYTNVIYENRACANQRQLKTRRYVYETDVTLKPEEFQDPQGYYIVFGNCCRNLILSNVVLPYYYGSTFITEFPALYQNGEAIIFNTPVFNALNGDYICINRLFKYDFSATDPDGDELRYKMTSPLSNKIRNSETVAAPYQKVEWANGSSESAQIPGNPALQINAKTGELSVKADRLGLFVFGLVCEKYRNGVKIGSVYHEFQLPVVDCFYKTPPTPIVSYLDKPTKEVLKCQDDTLRLTTENSPDWSFQWKRNGDNIAGATLSDLQVKFAGDYTVVKSFKALCSDDTTSSIVKVKDSTLRGSVKIQADKTAICQGESVNLLAQSPQASLATDFTWWKDAQVLPAQSNPFNVKVSGTYFAKTKASATLCASLRDSVKIQVFDLPDLSPATKALICFGDTASLSAKAQAGVSYLWNLGNKVVGTKASISVKDTGRYVLTLTGLNQCKVKSEPYLVAYNLDCLPTSFHLQIPDIFTPNGDNVNDVFTIRNITANPDCEVSIYNRWGNPIFFSQGYAQPWDGTFQGQPVESGVYAYAIKLPKLNFTYYGKVFVAY